MKFRGAKALLLAISLFSAPGLVADEIVYENSEQYLDKYATIAVEYGDEITLGGTARTITEMAFEYYGKFLSQADEVARVRFYATDGGPWIQPNGKPSTEYFLPGTVLWESSLFPVRQGFNTMDFNNINVTVPNTIIWTIEFFGLTMNTTPGSEDVAGLLYYYLPSVGLSYNDMWSHRSTGWQPEALPPSVVAKNDFGSIFFAVPEPSIVSLVTLGAAIGAWQLLARRRQ
jgi:hypothetical protein